MVASIFIIQGYDTFRRPERVAPLAEPVVRPLAERVPAVPAKTEQAVRINGAVQMVAGALLALGRFPRLSALAMAGTLVPTTLAGHRFWEADEDADQAQQRIHFLKNLSMFGGLLIAAADTAGNPSLAWRTRHAAKTARREASLVARTAKATSKASAKAGGRRKAGQVSARPAARRDGFRLVSQLPRPARRAAISHSKPGTTDGGTGWPLMMASSCQYLSTRASVNVSSCSSSRARCAAGVPGATMRSRTALPSGEPGAIPCAAAWPGVLGDGLVIDLAGGLSLVGALAGQHHGPGPLAEILVSDEFGELDPGVHLLGRRIVR